VYTHTSHSLLFFVASTGHLSEYQILVRTQLEVFEATTNDIECNTQGRKKPVVMYQVGLRCCHCAMLPLRSRGRGAVYYPAKLLGIYQAAQNMALSHLSTTCPRLSPLQKDELHRLRDRRDNANGGKQYWADGCRALGIIETECNGLRFASRPLISVPSEPEISSEPTQQQEQQPAVESNEPVNATTITTITMSIPSNAVTESDRNVTIEPVPGGSGPKTSNTNLQ
jgi:hypothetical protein